MSIVYHPDKILRTKALRVCAGEDIKDLISEMFRTMKENNGIGLAANQVGSHHSLFVMSIGGKDKVCVNPEILRRSDEKVVTVEGCLSFPERKIRTRRSKKIEVSYRDHEFNLIQEELEGISSVCFQHELDHLKGKTFLDREFNGRAI